jgi:hypothetical protein
MDLAVQYSSGKEAAEIVADGAIRARFANADYGTQEDWRQSIRQPYGAAARARETNQVEEEEDKGESRRIGRRVYLKRLNC